MRQEAVDIIKSKGGTDGHTSRVRIDNWTGVAQQTALIKEAEVDGVEHDCTTYLLFVVLGRISGEG